MKQYKHAVWDFIETFHSFNIIHHDRSYNTVEDKLVVLGSRFESCTMSPYCEYDIEILTTPYIPDNIKHWEVFEDDAQVQRFLQNKGEFTNQSME